MDINGASGSRKFAVNRIEIQLHILLQEKAEHRKKRVSG